MKDKLNKEQLQVEEEVIPAPNQPNLKNVNIKQIKLLGTGSQNSIYEVIVNKKRYADKHVKI